ncbi:MAG: tetratricopeptide repeat protein [Candidatus Obscuribacterales bacterium]|jgi:tetratricopeptide (TPR) repeat protein
MKCETIPELEKFLTIQEQALGQDSPEVAATVSKLADLYFNKGMLENAEALYRRALEIMERTLGPYRAEVADTKKCLEKVMTVRKKSAPSAVYPRPSSDWKQAMTDSSTSLDAIPQSVALGWPTSFPDDHEKEAELEVASVRQMMGKDHPHVADLLTKLADHYCRRRLYREMEPILIEALQIREKSLGGEHPLVSTSLKNLARLYYFQTRFELSEPLFKRALAIRQKVYSKDHPRFADVEEQYAKLLRKTNRLAQAQEMENHVRVVRGQFAAS